ncbi:FkbM family methyltransferase [Tateyamaria sp. SN3-11]|uniref:FkbM family methyltransferase n=1 Tax=Tateyamaria sp. SN3-11 TaxID=3092147 RepID=UPI0039EABABB
MADPLFSHRLAALAQALLPTRRMAVVDVGANPLGDPPYAPLAEAGLAELIGFEPQPDAYKALSATTPAHARFINAAVGPAGTASLNIYPQQSGLASLFKLREQTLSYLRRFQAQPGNASQVPVTLDSLDALGEVPAIDLLKLDVQGAELSVLQGGRTKLAQAEAVIVELRFFPLYEDEPTLADVHTELTDQGFGMHKLLDQNRFAVGSRHIDKLNRRRARSQLIDGDAVYIRDLDRIDTKTDDALITLALFSAGVWRSHDLVLRCLETLEDRGRAHSQAASDYIAALPSDLRRAVPA